MYFGIFTFRSPQTALVAVFNIRSSAAEPSSSASHVFVVRPSPSIIAQAPALLHVLNVFCDISDRSAPVSIRF